MTILFCILWKWRIPYSHKSCIWNEQIDYNHMLEWAKIWSNWNQDKTNYVYQKKKKNRKKNTECIQTWNFVSGNDVLVLIGNIHVFQGIEHILLEGIFGDCGIKGVVEEGIILVGCLGGVQTARLGVPVFVCPCKGRGQALGGTCLKLWKESIWVDLTFSYLLRWYGTSPLCDILSFERKNEISIFWLVFFLFV